MLERLQLLMEPGRSLLAGSPPSLSCQRYGPAAREVPATFARRPWVCASGLKRFTGCMEGPGFLYRTSSGLDPHGGPCWRVWAKRLGWFRGFKGVTAPAVLLYFCFVLFCVLGCGYGTNHLGISSPFSFDPL